MRILSIRKAGQRALGTLIFGFAALAFAPQAMADGPIPATTYGFSNIETTELRRKYEAATAEFAKEMQKYDENKAKFQRTLSLRGDTSRAGDILGQAIDEAYIAQLIELGAQFQRITAMEEALSLIAEIIDSRLLPLIFLKTAPEDKEAMGRKEDALNWAKQRFGSEMILMPAPTKPENRAESNPLAPVSSPAESVTTSI